MSLQPKRSPKKQLSDGNRCAPGVRSRARLARSESTDIRAVIEALTAAGQDDHQWVLDAIEAWKRGVYAGLPGTRPTPQELVELTDGLIDRCLRHGIGVDNLSDFKETLIDCSRGLQPTESAWKTSVRHADGRLNVLKKLLESAAVASLQRREKQPPAQGEKKGEQKDGMSQPLPKSGPVPNETTEQPIIDALYYRRGAIGLKGLKRIPMKERPTGDRLAPIAIGRACDGQFKATLAHMVDLGWLGNGRPHGLVGGYFLTELGATLVTKRRRKTRSS